MADHNRSIHLLPPQPQPEVGISVETAEILSVLTGHTIDQILETVDDVLGRYHYCEICDARTVLHIGHPHCLMCESVLMLRRCPMCLEHFCSTPGQKTDCFRLHFRRQCHQVGEQ